ncbi:MAG: hypothetical protein AAGG38_06285 [Planctomycetota bacterium]
MKLGIRTGDDDYLELYDINTGEKLEGMQDLVVSSRMNDVETARLSVILHADDGERRVVGANVEAKEAAAGGV